MVAIATVACLSFLNMTDEEICELFTNTEMGERVKYQL